MVASVWRLSVMGLMDAILPGAAERA
jgi:hypothetical protein